MKYKINPQLAFRKIGKETFIVDTKNSYLHKLNEVGSLIWECMKLGLSEKKIIEKILENFDVEYDTAKKDLKEFIEELKEKNIIVNDE
ncbi:MAG: PqqD family protein [Endomicrobia bacterium]|nr:PqqD family protein [Endomicrobiia bacterium]